jgi:hypothetical protein
MRIGCTATYMLRPSCNPLQQKSGRLRRGHDAEHFSEEVERNDTLRPAQDHSTSATCTHTQASPHPRGCCCCCCCCDICCCASHGDWPECTMAVSDEQQWRGCEVGTMSDTYHFVEDTASGPFPLYQHPPVVALLAAHTAADQTSFRSIPCHGENYCKLLHSFPSPLAARYAQWVVIKCSSWSSQPPLSLPVYVNCCDSPLTGSLPGAMPGNKGHHM